ncbi:MAG: response regulator, partial [Candidatus Latescibacter sp.]|nr:response regulator [Candidatus Latescibacter sp.]
MRTVFLVEDRPNERDAYKDWLSINQYEVVTASCIVEAKYVLYEREFAVVIVDMQIPEQEDEDPQELGGLTVIQYAVERNPLVRCIVLTRYGDLDNAIKAIRAGAIDYVQKATIATSIELLQRVESAFGFYTSQASLERWIQYYNQELGCPIHSNHTCNRSDEIIEKFCRNRIFVAIPFADYADEETAIKSVLEIAKLESVIAANLPESGELLCNICCNIRTCKYGIIDASRLDRLNIFYELGIMQAL